MPLFNDNKIYRDDDLLNMRVIRNKQTRKNWQDNCGFPMGRLIGPHMRAYTGKELNAWWESRPSERKELPQFDAHRRAGRPRKRDNNKAA